MGGPGSSNYCRWNRQTTVEETQRLDIRYMHRLRPGYAGIYSWSSGDRPSGSIRYMVEADCLVLGYRSSNGDNIEQRIDLDKTPCNYGGKRLWFLCPDCDARVAVLAWYGYRFVCRHCHGLPYGSQQEGYIDRMHRKARKIRKKLGATDNLLEPVWRKTKGMHQKTFARLKQEEKAANHAAMMALAKQIGIPELKRFGLL